MLNTTILSVLVLSVQTQSHAAPNEAAEKTEIVKVAENKEAPPAATTTEVVPAPTTNAPTSPATSVPPTTATPNNSNIPATSTTTVAPTPAPTSLPNQPINCNYHIPPTTTQIDSGLVTKWSEQAVKQSFDLDHETAQEQLALLKNCYTEQGWQSFNDALVKSGNINAIKSQKLNASSMVDGKTTISILKENQWRVTVSLQVVYQNTEEKLTQPLSVDLVVGRKPSGDLGIMQIIAVPREATPSPGTPGTESQKK